MSSKDEVMKAKLAKTLQRFETKIGSGDYYEAHQTLRTIANRYVRSKSYEQAIELISQGATSLLKAKQGGSGTDLIFYLLEVYDVAEVKVDEASVGRLIQLLVLINSQEPNVKDVVTGMNNWSIKHSDSKFGDPFLHNVIALKLLDGEHIYEAERYFMLGTHDSLSKYVDLIWQWFLQATEDSNGDYTTVVGEFFSRLVFNYLFIMNIKFTNEAKDTFLDLFVKKFTDAKHEVIKKRINKNNDEYKLVFFEDLKDINFFQLIILTCQTKDKTLFLNLNEYYKDVSTKYKSELEFLGQEYFGIKAQKQANFLQDMMSGLLGGGK